MPTTTQCQAILGASGPGDTSLRAPGLDLSRRRANCVRTPKNSAREPDRLGGAVAVVGIGTGPPVGGPVGVALGCVYIRRSKGLTVLSSSETAPTPLNLPLAAPQPNQPSLSVMFLVSSALRNKISLVVVGFETVAMPTPGSVAEVLARHVASSFLIWKLALMSRSVMLVMLGSMPPKLLY